jgi:hypothetical protein
VVTRLRVILWGAALLALLATEQMPTQAANPDQPTASNPSALQRRILADMPELGDPNLNDWSRIKLIRRWSYQTADLAATKETLLPFYATMWRMDLSEILKAFDADQGGVWCGGAASVMEKALRAFGYDEPVILSYGFLDLKLLTHAVVLVPIHHGGETLLTIQDPYFNLTYTTDAGEPVDYFDLLSALKNDREVQMVIESDTRMLLKDVLFVLKPKHTKNKSTLVRGFSAPRPASECAIIGDSMLRCVLAPNIDDFVAQHPLIRDTKIALEKRGCPADLLYLFLYPYGVFTDGQYFDRTRPSEFLCRTAQVLGWRDEVVCEGVSLADETAFLNTP